MKVQLIKPHTHGMHHYEPGETLEVSAIEGVWLAKHGVVGGPGRDTSHDVTHSTKRGKGRDHDREPREENDQ